MNDLERKINEINIVVKNFDNILKKIESDTYNLLKLSIEEHEEIRERIFDTLKKFNEEDKKINIELLSFKNKTKIEMFFEQFFINKRKKKTVELVYKNIDDYKKIFEHKNLKLNMMIFNLQESLINLLSENKNILYILEDTLSFFNKIEKFENKENNNFKNKIIKRIINIYYKQIDANLIDENMSKIFIEKTCDVFKKSNIKSNNNIFMNNIAVATSNAGLKSEKKLMLIENLFKLRGADKKNGQLFYLEEEGNKINFFLTNNPIVLYQRGISVFELNYCFHSILAILKNNMVKKYSMDNGIKDFISVEQIKSESIVLSVNNNRINKTYIWNNFKFIVELLEEIIKEKNLIDQEVIFEKNNKIERLLNYVNLDYNDLKEKEKEKEIVIYRSFLKEMFDTNMKEFELFYSLNIEKEAIVKNDIIKKKI